ncbi:CD276 antigen homolog [Emydura macquarii macquarii]|uniref:CD276 antigen homolog n=1 Tax=Emydura macquarii macquarii TaxID=1129001 RepID=UPI003529FA2B
MVTLWGRRAGTVGLSGFLFPLLFLGMAESQLVMSVGPSLVRATLGSDVLLPCNFTIGEPISLAKFYLAWAQEGTKVAVYQSKGLDYQREVQVFPQELSRGNCSLLLRSVSVGDGGKYTSTIIYTPNKEEKQLELQVTAVPTISIPRKSAVMDTASSFSCHRRPVSD